MGDSQVLPLEPLSREAFAPFGEVLDCDGQPSFSINRGQTQRFHQLANNTALQQGAVITSVFRATPYPLPFTIALLEKHPLGSQLFMPLQQRPFIAVVAEPDHHGLPVRLRAFYCQPHQGVNYAANTWHHPLIALQAESDFLVVDRSGPGHNCDELELPPEQQRLLLAPDSAGVR